MAGQRRFGGGGGYQNAGTGFAEGASDMTESFLGMLNAGNHMRYAGVAEKDQELRGRAQAMDEGTLISQRSPATLLGTGSGQGMPSSAPAGMPGEDGEDAPIGAQAMASQPPVQGPPNPYDPENLSVDDLRTLAFDRGQQAKGEALNNQNDIEAVQKAYHYSSMMKQTKPYMDKWAQGLMEVKKNPQDQKSYRMLQVLTGEDDPNAALSKATNEYAKLREQYETYSKNHTPLHSYLSKRGITPDMYDDEAKFIQLTNKKQFMPHSPGAARAGSTPRIPAAPRGR
jgi:hypothetical protein